MTHVIAPRFIGPAQGDTGYQVPFSCRFNSGSSAGLTKTDTTATNRKIQSFVIYGKRTVLGADETLFFSGFPGNLGNGDNTLHFGFDASDRFFALNDAGSAVSMLRVTTQVYRDVTAWFAFLVVFDSTQSTAGDRLKIYEWLDQITSFSSNFTATPQNADLEIGTSSYVNKIGFRVHPSPWYANSYMTNVMRIDGTVLSPTDVFETNGHGVPRPKNPAPLQASKGNGGWLLDFASSGNLGNDIWGGTDFTANSGHPSSSDQMTDTPTTNSCTLNPLELSPLGTPTFSDGNLLFSSINSAHNTTPVCYGSIRLPTAGKWYFEAIYTQIIGIVGDPGYAAVGIVDEAVPAYYNYQDDGRKSVNAAPTSYGSAMANGDVVSVLWDADNGSLTCWLNGVSQGVLASGLSLGGVNAWGYAYRNTNPGGPPAAATWEFNFGQQGFSYTPSAGYRGINTATLPTPPSAGSVTPRTGSFTGNASSDGPFVWLGYTPDESGTSTINGNTITWGTHARATAGGLKIITSSSSYNASGSNSYSIALLRPFGGKNTTPATAV